MKYTVTIGSRVCEVDLTGDRVVLDGRPFHAELRRMPGTPLRHLIVDGVSETLAMSRSDDGWALLRGGETVTAQVRDERTRQLEEMTAGGAAAGGHQIVKAPMPGLVLRIEVEVGTSVKRGSGLMVLEAMKMENELTAPIDGVVTAIHVEAGAPVDKGALLVEVSQEP